jgi:XTP/dITP diphosphohydrolase
MVNAKMTKLLLATKNPGKIREMKSLLRDVAVEIVIPSDLGLELQVEESGQTYAENASKKANIYSSTSGLLTLADDSGLEVEALNGAPGIFSARYSPKKGADDKDRRDYLLEQLQEISRPWTARFHCTVAVAGPKGVIQITEGYCPGEVIPIERGESGFGYDPIFLVNGFDRTMAELSLFEKNRISHRGKAIRSAIPILLSYL